VVVVVFLVVVVVVFRVVVGAVVVVSGAQVVVSGSGSGSGQPHSVPVVHPTKLISRMLAAKKLKKYFVMLSFKEK